MSTNTINQPTQHNGVGGTTSTRHASGTFEPIVYFVNGAGVIAIPPSTAEALRIRGAMERKGYQLAEAGTIAAVQDLQRRMQKQEQELTEGRLERERATFARATAERRQRLLTRRNSSWCSPRERDVIDHHLQMMDARQAAREKKERAVQHYFEALEFNSSSHHMMDAVESVPDMADEQCVKCASYRRVKGLKICAVCMNKALERA